MNIPQELRYTKEHEWVLLDDGVAIVGITDFAQAELGDIVYVELPTIGASLATTEAFGNVESVKSVSDLYAPISGVVADINTRLADSPETMNTDPYGEGWLLRLDPKDAGEVNQLLTAKEYGEYIGAEAE
ncbi:MAG: glycine cleavage system H protein [Gemmatimonadota bacterium]|nr:MAG: glycine cleavage system H protein [Gemmatimonadota bacterium]